MASGPKVDIGRDLVCFVTAQAGYEVTDTAGESYPEAADAIRVITGSGGGSIAFNPREDKFGTATAVPGIPQKRTAEGSIEGYVMPSGSRTTAPDIDELLTSSGWTKIDRSGTTTTSGASSTAHVLDCSSVTGFEKGDAIMVETSATSELYEMRRIVSIYAPSDQITVEPPLTFTPATGANIKGAIGYKPNDTRDTSEDALTLWLLNNNSGDRLAGWTPGSTSFTMGGEDAARFSTSGTAQRHARLFMTGIDGTLVTGATSVTVDDALASSGDLLNTYWLLDDGSTANEAIKVTAISGTTWTITRGAVSGYPNPGTTWPDSTTLVPFRPSGTYAGDPVPATSGQIVVSYGGYGEANAMELQCNSATLDCGFGLTYREDEMGLLFKSAGYVMSPREVTATLSGWSIRDANMIAAMQAWQTTEIAGGSSQQLSVACVSGQEEGLMFGWVAPRLRTEDMSLDRGAEEITLDLSGRCEGTSSGADEILLMFG